jgi:hypothetical protein
MNALLEKLLKKRGIESVKDMRTDEQEVFDKWERILGEGEITVERLQDFCRQQIKIIEGQYSEPDNSDKKDAYFKACLNVYSTLLRAIESPKAERQALEKYLQQLIQ